MEVYAARLLRLTERAQSDRRLVMNDWPFVDRVRVKVDNSVMIKGSNGRLVKTVGSG